MLAQRGFMRPNRPRLRLCDSLAGRALGNQNTGLFPFLTIQRAGILPDLLGASSACFLVSPKKHNWRICKTQPGLEGWKHESRAPSNCKQGGQTSQDVTETAHGGFRISRKTLRHLCLECSESSALPGVLSWSDGKDSGGKGAGSRHDGVIDLQHPNAFKLVITFIVYMV